MKKKKTEYQKYKSIMAKLEYKLNKKNDNKNKRT